MTTLNGGFLEPRAPPWGVGGMIKIIPENKESRNENRESRNVLTVLGSNTPLAEGQANFFIYPLFD